jgi:hypothetical protein
MAITNRVRRLERRHAGTRDGMPPCAQCRSGKDNTGVQFIFEGEPERSDKPTPCPGCGRVNPAVFIFANAVPTARHNESERPT